MDSANVLGIKIDLFDEKEVLEKIIDAVSSHSGFQIVTVNPEIILLSRKNQFLKKIVNSSWLSLPDGVGVIWALKKRIKKRIKRITGIDLAEILFQKGAALNWNFYFLGSRKDIIEKAVKNLSEKFPGIKICGFNHGFFSKDEESEVVEKIGALKPDILLVGLGMGKQEEFIFKNLKKLNFGVAIGVGGAFDIWSGALKRAPLFFQKFKIEWLFRFLQQPSRLKRILSLLTFTFLNIFPSD